MIHLSQISTAFPFSWYGWYFFSKHLMCSDVSFVWGKRF
jgi:hypothetical protein